ncbi:hypothetical protein GF337_11685 [candidate division KSB1 bacterium]|nr:hypothetical protein [candidate division KSB1 bacterium]
MFVQQFKNTTSGLTEYQFNFLNHQIEKLESTLSHLSSKPDHNRLNTESSLQRIQTIQKFARQYEIPAIDALSNTVERTLKNSLQFNGKNSFNPKPDLEYFIFALKTITSRYSKNHPIPEKESARTPRDKSSKQPHPDNNEKSSKEVTFTIDRAPSVISTGYFIQQQFTQQTLQATKLKNGTIGIDIGHSSVKIVVFDKIREKLYIVNWHIHKYKKYGIKPNLKEIVKVIYAFFEKYKDYKKLPIITSLIDNNQLIRCKRLPPMSDRNFIRTAELEIRSEFFFEDREVGIFTYPYPTNINETRKHRHGIVLAVDHKLIKKTVRLFKKSGYKINQLSIDTLVLAQFKNEANQVAAIIDIGIEKIKIIVIDNKIIRFARTIDSHEYKITKEISALEKVNLREADTIKRNMKFLLKCNDAGKEIMQELRGENGTPQNLMFQHLRKVADEIHLSLQFYNTEHDNPIENIYLCGGGALLPGINDFLSLSLELPVYTLDVMKNIQITGRKIKRTDQRHLFPLLATAVGLCKVYHQPAMNLQIDLRKKIDVRRNKKIRALIAGTAIPLLFILASFGMRTFFLYQAGKLQRSINEKQHSINQLNRKISDLQHFNTLKDKIDLKIRKIKALKYNQPRWSIVLSEVSETIPEDIWLTHFSGNFQSRAEEEEDDDEYEQDSESEHEPDEKTVFSQVTISGQTSQRNQIKDFIYSMEQSENFRYINFNKVKSRQSENANITNFQLFGRIQISELEK